MAQWLSAPGFNPQTKKEKTFPLQRAFGKSFFFLNEAKCHLWYGHLKKIIDYIVVQIFPYSLFQYFTFLLLTSYYISMCVSTVLDPQAEGWKGLPELDPEQHSPLPLHSYAGLGGQVCVLSMFCFLDIWRDLGSVTSSVPCILELILYVLCAWVSFKTRDFWVYLTF